MADLLNRTAVDTAIDNLLDDGAAVGSILPSLHNQLLKDILDTLDYSFINSGTVPTSTFATLTDTLTFNGGSGAIFKLYSTLRTDDIFQVFFNGGGEWLAKNGSIDIGAGITYSNYFTRFYERGIKFYGAGVVVHEINNTTGNVYFMNDYMAGGKFTIGSNSPIGSEKISFQNRTAVKGADTLSTSTAFEIYDGDTTPSKIFEVRNNGDIYTNSNQGLSATYTFGGGSTGHIASMTFTNGILTAITTVP